MPRSEEHVSALTHGSPTEGENTNTESDLMDFDRRESALRVSRKNILVDEEFEAAGLKSDSAILQRFAGVPQDYLSKSSDSNYSEQ